MALMDKAYVTSFEDLLVSIKLSPYSLNCLSEIKQDWIISCFIIQDFRCLKLSQFYFLSQSSLFGILKYFKFRSRCYPKGDLVVFLKRGSRCRGLF